jgi:hypothetical protein
MIGRIFRNRREPGSIFEHIDAHVHVDAPGLADGGEELPDERTRTPGDGSRLPAGALEGIFAVAGPGPLDEEAIDALYDALTALAAKPNAVTRGRLRRLFREGDVRVRIDGLRERLSAESPPHAELLYPELREILLTSGHRDEVKYSMALMSGFGRREDAELFRVLGRHEEFTLYAAVALATVSDDPVAEWLALLEHVSGWGRTELAELILRDPQPERVRERVLCHGLGYGNALALARGCRLDQLLARHAIGDDLLAGALSVIDELVRGSAAPFSLADYADAGAAVEALLGHLAGRPRSGAAATTARALRNWLEAAEGGSLEASGFDDERRGRLRRQCSAYLAEAAS